MTKTEFMKWIEDYVLRFPNTKLFLNKAQQNQDGSDNHELRKTFLAGWYEFLQSHELDDALLVNTRMLGGRLPVVGNEQEIPARVAQHCLDLETQRKAPDFKPEFYLDGPIEKPVEKYDWSGSEVLQAAHALAAEGLSGQELKDRLRAMMPIDPEKQKRLRCLLCEDRGRVTVWDQRSMRLASLGKLTTKGGCYAAFVVCSCNSGDQFITEKLPNIARYNPDDCLKCSTPMRQDQVDKLVEFMAGRKQNSAKEWHYV